MEDSIYCIECHYSRIGPHSTLRGFLCRCPCIPTFEAAICSYVVTPCQYIPSEDPRVPPQITHLYPPPPPAPDTFLDLDSDSEEV